MIGDHPLRMVLVTLLLAAASAATAAAAGEYRTFESESLRIVFDSEWVPSAAPGYLPVRLEITNLGDDRDIQIVGQGNRFDRRSMRFRQRATGLRYSLRLASGDRVRLTIPVPTSGETDNMQFQVEEGGRSLETLGFVTTHRQSDVSALIVMAPGSGYGAMAAAWPRTSTMPTGRVIGVPPSAAAVPPAAGMTGAVVGGPAMPAGPALDFILEPARLPTSWLGYTSVQAVVFGAREWEGMDEPQRTALLTWLAAGGSLILVDTGLETLFPDGSLRPVPDAAVAPYFLGHVHLQTSAGIETAGFDSVLSAARAAVPEPSFVLPVQSGSPATTSGFNLPIPGVEGIPSSAYLAILTVFAILIGPVNHIVLRRRRQQALIVLTTPLIAAGFILLLAGYVVVFEGFGVTARAVTFTRLDQSRSQSVTRATASLYAAGRAPSRGLRFGRDVAVFPTAGNSSRGRDQVDLTTGQQFTAGIIEARTPANFEAVSVRPARERMQVTRGEGGLRVTNGLGATVTQLRLLADGRSYRLEEPLPDGASASLRETRASGRDLLVAGDSALSRFDALVTSQRDGSYLAVLERSPFWESGTNGLDERGSFHLVLGTGWLQP